MNSGPGALASCPNCPQLQARVVELELRYMDLEQQVEELTSIVHRQADQLDRLARELQSTLAGDDDDTGMTDFL